VPVTLVSFDHLITKDKLVEAEPHLREALAIFREHLATMIREVSGGGTSHEVATAGGHVGDFFALVAQAVRDQSMEHSLLVTFGVVALILVLFMLRT